MKERRPGARSVYDPAGIQGGLVNKPALGLAVLAVSACSAPGAPSITKLAPAASDGIVYVQHSLEIDYAVAGAADEVRIRIDDHEAVLPSGGRCLLPLDDVP